MNDGIRYKLLFINISANIEVNYAKLNQFRFDIVIILKLPVKSNKDFFEYRIFKRIFENSNKALFI